MKAEVLPELLQDRIIRNLFIPPAAEDYSFLNQTVGIVLEGMSNVSSKQLVLDLFLQKYPRNFILHTQRAQSHVRQRLFNQARRGFTRSLQLCPTYSLAWKLLLDLEEAQNAGEMRSLLLCALAHLPESKTLRDRSLPDGDGNYEIL